MLPTEVVGKGKVKVLFVGQGGGTTEGSLKRPFVGRAGMTQRKIIRHAKLDLGLSDVKGSYALGNTCRFAPGWEEKKNRTPSKEELDFCLPYLERDILRIQPKTIVLLGDAAFHAFFPILNTREYRGKFLKLKIKNKTFKVIFTYHPSYGLRKPDILGKILHDVKLAFGYKQPNIHNMGKSQKKRT
jgi:DNA polymerase